MIGLSTKSLNPPHTIQGLMQGQWAGAIISTAASLKIFDAVDLGFRSPDEVARESGIQPKAAELLLNALVGVGLLSQDEKGYHTTEESHYYLVSTSPLYVGKFFEIRPKSQEAWMNLGTVLKTGKPYNEINKQETAQQFFPALAAALFSINYAYAKKLAEFLGMESRQQPVKVLDVACGSAVWSIPMARENKGVHVEALDFPVVIETAREFTEKSGVSEQYSYLCGDWQDLALEEDKYDIAVLGHILHSEGKGRSKELLSCVAKSLKKGGSIAVAEFLVNEHRNGPAFSSMFAINMYLVTTNGCVFSKDELTEMLKEAGFTNVRSLPLEDSDTSVLIADRA
ncbi:MAG: methyltransferase domain-containing protein [Candidatus Obscuribacterales bacterium]|nr:methyltransferase domain-containing protein [Candidatus Obscuribacterales bacterium]